MKKKKKEVSRGGFESLSVYTGSMGRGKEGY